MSGTVTIFYGAVVTSVDATTWKAMPRCLLAVGSTGNIDWLIEHVGGAKLTEALKQKGLPLYADIVELQEGEFIIPGFIDTHTHAPQFPNLGRGGQYELLDWLNKITFPKEKEFEDVDFAKDTYTEVVRRSLDCGTTTSCYYATLHLDATKVLAECVNELGQRTFIGKCNMDRKGESPDDYVEETQASLDDTAKLISHIRSLPPVSSHASIGTAPEPLVQPILTPRFAISCTSKLLCGIRDLADKYAAQQPRMRIQTHISENPKEIEYTLKLFPDAESYADVYDSHGVLRDTTILGHAVHLTDDEIGLIKSRNAGISHCPTSNFNLSSGVAPIGRYLDEGMKVGLGTDVSGGYAMSMLNAIQNASVASKVIAMKALTLPPPRPNILVSEGSGQLASPPFTPPPESAGKNTTSSGFANQQLPIPTLFYLATLGGARVCNLTDRTGSFSPGKSFDALVVSVRDETGAIGVWGKDAGYENNTDEDKEQLEARKKHEKEKVEENLERFLFCGDDRNILRVYVQGRLVGGKLFHK